ncbi:hypothetical protein [Modestobacter versicolor]|uniref:hypothetical protein n=1 Tax=Modestobacter versicolor TaxID=429133 RepID=UPI0034DE5F5A
MGSVRTIEVHRRGTSTADRAARRGLLAPGARPVPTSPVDGTPEVEPADEPSTAAVPTPEPVDGVRAEPPLRAYRAALAGLVVAQVALLSYLAGRSYFFTDDLLYGSLLRSEPLTLDLLFRSWFGHLVPGFIAVDWFFINHVGMDWTAAAAIMVAATVGGTVAMSRLLDALTGRAWRNLVVTALFGFSLFVTTQVMWWGAVLTNVVPLAASIATMGCFVRWVRTGRTRHLVGMAVLFLVAVSFYEKSVLTAAYVGLISLLVLDAGLPWRDRVRTTLSRWPAWLLLGVVAGADVGWYLTHEFIVEAGPAPTHQDLAAFLFFSFTEGFAPSFLGVHHPVVDLLGSGVLTLVLANAALLGLALLTSLRSRVALQAWVFFALAYLLNQGVLGRGRVGLLGPHLGTTLRYQLEDVALFCIALAVAVPALARLRSRRAAAPSAPSSRRLPVRRGWVVLALCVLVLAPFWVQSLRAEVSASAGVGARTWFDSVRTSLAEEQRADPDVAFVDGELPPWLVFREMAPFNRYSRALPPLLDGATVTQTEDTGLVIDDAGVVQRVAFDPVADLGGAGTCLTPGSDVVSLTVPASLPEDLWFVRIRYAGQAPGAVQLTGANAAVGADLRLVGGAYDTVAGEGQLVVAPGRAALAYVTLQLTSGPGVCLTGVEVGAMRPAG